MPFTSHGTYGDVVDGTWSTSSNRKESERQAEVQIVTVKTIFSCTVKPSLTPGYDVLQRSEPPPQFFPEPPGPIPLQSWCALGLPSVSASYEHSWVI